jgi:hypothetical protein
MSPPNLPVRSKAERAPVMIDQDLVAQLVRWHNQGELP